MSKAAKVQDNSRKPKKKKGIDYDSLTVEQKKEFHQTWLFEQVEEELHKAKQSTKNKNVSNEFDIRLNRILNLYRVWHYLDN